MFDKYDLVKSTAWTIGERVSDRLKVKLRLDEAAFQEAMISAQTSCSFHGSDGEANHIKKVSHIIFWIVKLKPFALVQTSRSKVSDKLGITSFIETLDQSFREQRRVALEAEINEIVALSLADNLISKGFDDIKSKISDGKAKGIDTLDKRQAALKELEQRMNQNKDRIMRMFSDIVRSFREHNYTSRALATMLHLSYSTGHESLHEIGDN